MKVLRIKPTRSTPELYFDANRGFIEIQGRCIPDNPCELFYDVEKWIKEYIQDIPSITHFKFDLEYINTSSLMCLVKVIDRIKTTCKGRTLVKIDWHYEADDENSFKTGEELMAIVGLPVNFLQKTIYAVAC